MSQTICAEIDASGLKCPEPVMMLHAAIRDANVGDVVRVKATDPSTKRDIPNFCDFLGHHLVSESEEEGVLFFLVQKGK